MFLNKVNRLKHYQSDYPKTLKQVTPPVDSLFYIGSPPLAWMSRPKLAVVGSRKMTAYGKEVADKIVKDLAGSGVVIISGLALGIDAAAHSAAIEAGGLTVAVLPTSVETVYPASHQSLAKRIVGSGGCLLSEYPAGSEVYRHNFIARNRIVSGLADVVLIPEAAVNSGSLHTARFALETGKTVMAVPNSIFRASSEGCNNLIKAGAGVVTSSDDIFFALGLEKKRHQISSFRGTKQEETVYRLIKQGISSQEQLALKLSLDAATLNSALTSLEIAGAIRPYGNGQWLPS